MIGIATLVFASHLFDGGEIVVGCATSITGDNKPWGIDQLAGCRMAVAEANKAGGVRGKKIRMVIADTASKPDIAIEAGKQLIDQDVVAIVGECSSGNTMQLAKVAFEKGIPVVAVAATRPVLSENGNVFRVCITDDRQGPAMANFSVQKLGFKRVATITDNALPYSTRLDEDFERQFSKLGGKIVAKEVFESGGMMQADFTPLLKKIAKTKPEAIYCSGYFTEVGDLIKQARALGITAVFLGGDGWDSDSILKSSRNKAIGSYFTTNTVVDDPEPESKAFIAKWVAGHKGKMPPTICAALGYDAMRLTIDALKRTKDQTPSELTTALEQTTGFRSTGGVLNFKGMMGNPRRKVVIAKITKVSKNGSWQSFAGSVIPTD